MVDLTIVSCVSPCLPHQSTIESATLLIEPLVTAGVPAVVYVEDDWREALAARWSPDSLRWHPSSIRQRRTGFPFMAQLEAQLAAVPRANGLSLDSLIVDLTKMGMLHDQSIWNPFGTRYMVWIDADISASVHPRYFSDEGLLQLLPCLLRRFFLLTRPAAVADAAGRAGATKVQGQLFGGELAAIAETNGPYYQLLEHLLRHDELPTPESIFTLLVERCPERYDRCVLQDNGLLGFFFEQMRSGRVAIERTSIH